MDTKTKDTISKRLLRILGSTKQTEQKLLDRYCQLYPPVVTQEIMHRETQSGKLKNRQQELRDTVRKVFHRLVENEYILKDTQVTTRDSTQVLYFQTNATFQQFENDRFHT